LELLLGALLPYLFGAMGMTAVGRAAARWSRKSAASSATIRASWKARPSRTTRARSTWSPGGDQGNDRPVAAAGARPIVVFFVIRPVRAGERLRALGALLIGVIVSGLFVAISMTSGGGAWDNAKKYIEDGNYGGKGSEAHKAAVTGDTVGDPYKDTAGPAVNPMIKITNIVALLLLAALAASARTRLRIEETAPPGTAAAGLFLCRSAAQRRDDTRDPSA
jgi:K(+)-stimulated pyrophosphate-energized sodium pump